MNCDVAVSIGDSIFGVPFSEDFVKEVKKLNEEHSVPYLFVQRRNGNLMYYAWSFYDNKLLRNHICACFNGVMINPDAIIGLSDAIYSIEGNINSTLQQAEELLRSSDLVCEELPPIDYGYSKPDFFCDSLGIVKNISSYVKYNSRIAIPLKKPKPRLVKEFPRKETKKDKNSDRFVPLIYIGIIMLFFLVCALLG